MNFTPEMVTYLRTLRLLYHTVDENRQTWPEPHNSFMAEMCTLADYHWQRPADHNAILVTGFVEGPVHDVAMETEAIDVDAVLHDRTPSIYVALPLETRVELYAQYGTSRAHAWRCTSPGANQ
jgi:hypothetical protein